MKKLISIIVPLYNEEEIVKNTVIQLNEIASHWNEDFEIIFVNDGSLDKTYQILKEIAKNNKKIKIINFSRNFGHQMAFTAGIDFAKGDAVIVIDGDLQDPPEIMTKFVKKWKEGYQVVYGKRLQRKGENYFKLISAKLFYRFMATLSDISIPKDTGDFRLMDKIVINKLISMREKHRFIRGMVSWVGFKQTSVEYVRNSRIAGKTKFPLNKMLKFALDAIFSFSTTPIKYTLYFGFFSMMLSLSGIIFVLLSRLITDNWVSGWITIIIAVLFIGGVQLISIGVLGEYIGRIFEEIKRRPLYIIESTFNIDK